MVEVFSTWHSQLLSCFYVMDVHNLLLFDNWRLEKFSFFFPKKSWIWWILLKAINDDKWLVIVDYNRFMIVVGILEMKKLRYEYPTP